MSTSHSLYQDAWLRLRRNSMAIVSLGILTVIFLLCFALPFIGSIGTPENSGFEHWFKDPNHQDLNKTFLPASAEHWLGTDQSGRDIFARLLYGGQISLLVGLVATSFSLIIGISYGSIAGYVGGRTDALMMRFVDILYGLPFLVLVILFSLLISEYMESLTTLLRDDWGWNAGFVTRFTNLIPLFVAIGSLGWLTMARMARAQTLNIKKQEYVEAAVSLGLSHRQILTRHILPNMMGPIIVYATLTVPGFILFEASLSYLGLGVSSPNSSWGILLKDGANYMETAPQLLIIPSVLFSITLFALNFLGDGLRDALDPKAAKD
ncbi:ABC transporter permease [Rubritalea marina]|uniref:ABC transporter permease n=1 Tax=Rubritalea marina TaxID=361055 RepID=UPI0003A2C9DC|nr:ABC transporter permease [Rubritalea marina]